MGLITISLLLVIFLGFFLTYTLWVYPVGKGLGIGGGILIFLGVAFVVRVGIHDLLWLYRNKDEI